MKNILFVLLFIPVVLAQDAPSKFPKTSIDINNVRIPPSNVVYNPSDGTYDILGQSNAFLGKDSLYFGTPGDSVSDVTANFYWNELSLTRHDTGSVVALGGFADSILGFYYNPNLALWDTLRFIDADGNRVKILTGVSGGVSTWKVDLTRPYRVKVVLINYRAEYPARKTYISWSGRN
jgi:hypothetical protein